MLRLVWKDLVAARLILLAALPVYALNLAAMSAALPVRVSMALLFSGVLAFGSLAMESVQGTDGLWASMPVRRRDIVLGRYLTAVVGAGLGLGISLAVERVMIGRRAGAGTFITGPGPSLELSVAAHLVLFLMLMLAASVLLPLCFRLGAGHGTLAFGAVAMGGLLLISLGGQLVLWLAGLPSPFLEAGLWSDHPDAARVEALADALRARAPVLLGLAGLVVALAVLVSAGISCRLYETRDITA